MPAPKSLTFTLFDLGDMTDFGAPVAYRVSTGTLHAALMDEPMVRYLHARTSAILAKVEEGEKKSGPLAAYNLPAASE